MNKWKKILIVSAIVFTTILAFCIYTATNQAYSLVNASINVSKRQSKIDSLQKEIENLETHYNEVKEKINSLKTADSLGLDIDSIYKAMVESK